MKIPLKQEFRKTVENFISVLENNNIDLTKLYKKLGTLRVEYIKSIKEEGKIEGETIVNLTFQKI